MTRKLIVFLLFVSAAILNARAGAQAQFNPSPDQQAMIQEMQQNMQTMMQNMQAKGIDPQQFFQQIQSGADPADIQQQLIDKGVIDQKMMDQMQSTGQRLAFSAIKQQLNIGSDDEWNAIQPLLQRVIAASADFNRGRPGAAAGGGFMIGQSGAPSEVAKALRDLKAALNDPAATDQQISALLQNLRTAREKARTDLEAAASALRTVLKVRQESILLLYGILQ